MGTLARVLAPLAALILLAATPMPTAAAIGSDVTYTVQTLHFAVLVGPGGAEHCDIVGDLYTPSDASRTPGPRSTRFFAQRASAGSANRETAAASRAAANGSRRTIDSLLLGE